MIAKKVWSALPSHLSETILYCWIQQQIKQEIFFWGAGGGGWGFGWSKKWGLIFITPDFCGSDLHLDVLFRADWRHCSSKSSDIVLKLPQLIVSGSNRKIFTSTSVWTCQVAILIKTDISELECKLVCLLRWTGKQHLYCRNFKHACHIFLLNNKSLLESNRLLFYNTVDFSVESLHVQGRSLIV